MATVSGKWTQLLTDLLELSEEELDRILDKSPDVQTALSEWRTNADNLINESIALRQLGHEND